MLGISSPIASLTLTSLGFPTPCTSTHLRLYTQWWAGPSLVEFPVKWVTRLRCDWFSVILMEHTDSKNKISLDPRLHSSSRGEGTPVPGQGVMKRQWGALLGLLCIQICCELESSQRGGLGSVHSWQWEGGKESWPGAPRWSYILRCFLREFTGLDTAPMTPQWHQSFMFASPSFQAGVRGVKVEQSPSVLSLQEGANSTLRCNFSTSINYVQWFQQNPGGSFISLFFIASGTKQNERLSSTVNSKELYSTLHITASQLEDAATYLCAVEAQCSQMACSLYPNCSCLSHSPWHGTDLHSSICIALGSLIHFVSI